MLYMSSGMLPSYRFGCASAWPWLVDVVVVSLWPRASAPASSAWLCLSRLKSLCSWRHLQVFEMSGRCVLQVVFCQHTGWIVLVLLACRCVCGCLWPRASALASSAWGCWSRLVSLCSPDGR